MVEKALVVDDDFLMRGYTVESLQKEEIAVVEACNVEEAGRRLACQRFDFIFADLRILETGERVLNQNPDALRIVLTSFSNVDRAIHFVKGGAYDYLVKPFSPEQVSLVVSRARELIKLRSRLGRLELQLRQAEDCVPQTAEAVSASAAFQPEESATTNLQDLERQTIIRVLHETGGSRSVMAEKLGISVRTLRNKLTQYKQKALLQLP